MNKKTEFVQISQNLKKRLRQKDRNLEAFLEEQDRREDNKREEIKKTKHKPTVQKNWRLPLELVESLEAYVLARKEVEKITELEIVSQILADFLRKENYY